MKQPRRLRGGAGKSKADDKDNVSVALSSALPQPLRIEHAVTADDFDGRPWPPSFPGNWHLIDSRNGFSWWRRISLGADHGT
jgi:hypothetical protein